MDKKSTILLILIIAVSVICRVTIDMDENSAGQLTLFIIACFLVLPFAVSPKLQKNKKASLYSASSLLRCSAVIL